MDCVSDNYNNPKRLSIIACGCPITSLSAGPVNYNESIEQKFIGQYPLLVFILRLNLDILKNSFGLSSSFLIIMLERVSFFRTIPL